MSMSCSTSSIAVPRSSCTARSVSVSARVSSRSRPDDGSSSSSSRGSVISARPTSTSRPRPRLSASIGRSASRVRPSSSSVASIRAFSSALGFAEPEHVLPQRTVAGGATVPRRADAPARVIPAKSSMRWNVRPIPRRARLCVGQRRRCDAPPSRTVPPFGRSVPEQAVEQRGLARAVRPDQPDELAFADGQAHLGERGDARERHRHVLGDEERVGGGHVTRRSTVRRRALSRARRRRPPQFARPARAGP